MASVPKIAIRYKIPLILWGENPGLQLGDMKSLGRNGYDGNNLRNLNTLAGGSFQWLFEAGFTKENLISYSYATPSEFAESNIQIIYLGWFWKDWSGLNNGMYSLMNGLQIRDDDVKNAHARGDEEAEEGETKRHPKGRGRSLGRDEMLSVVDPRRQRGDAVVAIVEYALPWPLHHDATRGHREEQRPDEAQVCLNMHERLAADCHLPDVEETHSERVEVEHRREEPWHPSKGF